MYLIVALVIYCYAGTAVASPALGSTSPLIRKIAYGIATPTIMYVSYSSRLEKILITSISLSLQNRSPHLSPIPRIAGVIYAQVASKCIYVRLFRGTDRMSQKSWSSFGVWALIVTALWVTAWVIAEAIPGFNNLLSLISALFASWFTYGISGVFWLFLNRGRYGSCRRKMVLTGVNVGCFFLGGFIVSVDTLLPSSIHISFLYISP